jgi:parvulin-like peptidyl-prolyl isomerase
VDKQNLRRLYLSYAKTIFRTLNTTSIELEQLEKQEWDKFKEEKETWKSVEDSEEIRRRRNTEGTVSIVSYTRRERSHKCRWIMERNQRDLLRTVVEEYPGSAPRIHSFFFEIGYSKEQLLATIQRESKFSKNIREAKYLLNGLPKPKEAKTPAKSNKSQK